MSGFGKSGEVHRTQPPVSIPEIIPFDRTFSAFDFFDQRFRRCGASVRRCFSLARSFGSRTFVLEEIAPIGMAAEENDLLSALGGKSGECLYRLSFWKSEFFVPDDIAEQESSSLVGYVLVKHDSGFVDGSFKDVWYVFESVFVKYEHRHNCIARPCTYSVMVGCKGFTIDGVLYCQQNGLTKKCAHVALRSLLSRFAADGDANYALIHKYARKSKEDGGGVYRPWEGLSSRTIQDVLDSFGVTYNAFDYDAVEKKDPTRCLDRYRHPYQSYVYSGVEAGMGALMGFKVLDAMGKVRGKHIIPFYGHTFNKDTWVSDADTSYFKLTQKIGYMRSENWTSSFIGHDDNFGQNFCVPRLYMRPEHVDYVVALHAPGVKMHSKDAEVAALSILQACLKSVGTSGNSWSVRLRNALAPSERPSAVIRTVQMDSKKYIEHLKKEVPQESLAEESRLLDRLCDCALPKRLVVAEVSVAQLFPANEHKVAEVVFDGSEMLTPAKEYLGGYKFSMVRMPGKYIAYLPDRQSEGGVSRGVASSGIITHIPLYGGCVAH